MENCQLFEYRLMQILVIGNRSNLEELSQKFGPFHTYFFSETGSEISERLKAADVVFDFAPTKDTIIRYSIFETPVFLNSSFITLDELLLSQEVKKRYLFFGFCGLPTFFNRSVLEVTLGVRESESYLRQICLQLATDFVCVEDRVGLVTPRVICMIINEAYYALEEGIATREDIDLAMKLGTNYPFGPFEWARQIGITHVVKLLDAVYHDTSDERYKVCPLLRSELNN